MINTKCHIRLVACLLVVALVITFSPQQCLAGFMDPVLPADYISSLNAGAGGGLTATGDWSSSSTIISWIVTPEIGYYNYSYTFTVPRKSLSHSILQVSDPYPEDELALVNTSLDPVELFATLDTWGTSNSNPGIPGSVYGLKFENITDDDPYFGEGSTWTWSFNSLRMPMWGNFYAKSGVGIYAYNTGFEYPDTGSFIVVPDTEYVPVPPAVLLGMLGMGVAGVKLRKYA